LNLSTNCILYVDLSKFVNNGIDKRNVAMLVVRATHFVGNSHDLLAKRSKSAPKTGRNITVLRIG
jgi:microcystin degradation protein MlrC